MGITKRANIREVAKAAGVSIAAASHILNGIGHYADPTIKRVWTAANSLNYSPNPYVKKIFSREAVTHIKTRLLLRVSYFTAKSSLYDDGRAFEAQMMFAFERACWECDYSGTNYYYRHRQGFRSHLLLNDSVDGVVLGLGHREIVSSLPPRIPAVMVDVCSVPADVGMPVVNFDYARASGEAFAALRERHRDGKLAVIYGYNSDWENSVVVPDEEVSCIVQAAKKNGIICENEHRIFAKVDPDSNAEVTEQIATQLSELIRNNGVHIIFSINMGNPDLLRQCLMRKGIRLPEDAVIVSRYYYPLKIEGIITLVGDWDKLYSTAVKVLVQRIDAPSASEVYGQYLVPCQPVVTSYGNNLRSFLVLD